MRKIHLANEKKRDAEVGFEMNRLRVAAKYVTASGEAFAGAQLLKSTSETEPSDLQRETPDLVELGRKLIAGDPEIDKELVGRKLEGLHKVYVTPNGKVAYGVTLAEHLYTPDGVEKETRPLADTPANIALTDCPIRWTGKLFPRTQAIRKFVFSRSYQLHHVNGLTYDFLYEMAKKLADAKALMLVGGGEKGVGPLVLTANGTAYRGFLEGRVKGDKYMLLLHLTNLELKEIPHA